MNKFFILLLLTTLMSTASAYSAEEGLPVGKYLEDPEHKNEVMVFYLSTIFTGINLANSRINPPLFCMDNTMAGSALDMIDHKINTLQKEKKLSADMTVDAIMMDLLIEAFPCK